LTVSYTRVGAGDLVSRASSQVVVDALREVSERASIKHAWLGPGHHYRGNISAVLNKNRPAPAKGLPGHTPIVGSLAQYVACSTFLHAFDGWNYVARAFDALLSGERRIAVHLAYYAELRAAMSLLATQGIGVFDKRHVGLENRRSAVYHNGGTHSVCWQFLRDWAKSGNGARVLLDSVKVQSGTLSMWLDKASVGPLTRALVADDWLTGWSIDLKRFDEDQRFRNEVSYRPDGIRWPDTQAFHPDAEIVEPLIECWEALKPSTPGTADLLDSHLLREALRLAFSRDSGLPHSDEKFGEFISHLEPDASPVLRGFLTDSGQPHPLLVYAADDTRNSDNVTAIVSRAVLLLRLASALTSQTLRSAGVNLIDADFWWTKKVDDLGLWNSANQLSDFLDLWPEVEVALESTDDWKAQNPQPQTSRSTMSGLRPILAFSQLQRAGFWLFAS